MCAVIKQGILGGGSGSVANVVMSSWKGIAIIKSKPLSVSNPNSTAQQAQRSEMTGCVAAARVLLAALIQTYWNPFAQRMSGYNAFVKENIATFTAGTFTDFANFFSMRGSLLGVVLGASSASAAGSDLDIAWTDNSGQSDALGTDEMVITYYNETQDYWIVDAGSAIRSAAAINIADTNIAQNDELRVYVGVSRPNISKVSDSVYVNITVGA
jgi:hypothetical protein